MVAPPPKNIRRITGQRCAFTSGIRHLFTTARLAVRLMLDSYFENTTTANMFNKQTLKTLLNERLSETAEEIFLLFEQAVAEYQRETERLKHVGEAGQLEAVPSPQWTKEVQQEEVAETILQKGNGRYFPCEVKTEPSMTQEDEPPMLMITNVTSLFNGDELQLRGREQTTNSEGPEASGAAGTENSPETSPEPEEEEDSDDEDASKETFSCPACNKCFPQIRCLKVHIGRVHPGEKQLYDEVWKPVRCSVCNKDFIHQCRLKIHMRIHTGERPYVCTACGKRFSTRGNLKSHLRTHKGNNKPFRCGKCGGRYTFQTSLKQHNCAAVVLSPKLSLEGAQATETASHEAQAGLNKDNTGSCHYKAEKEESMITPKEEPQTPIVNMESLNPGEEQASGGAESNNCPETSPEPGEDSDTANDEDASRSDTSKETFSCPACKKCFPRIRGLKTHMRAAHPREKKLYAAVCKDQLDREQFTQTNPDVDILIKPLSCTVCFRRFKLQSFLDVHMRAHAEEKPRTCAECGASFPNQFSFISHMRQVHSSDKPFRCTVCYSNCRDLTCLRIHMRSHTGERPYLCSVCGKGFTIKGNLKNHMRTHNGNKPFRCEKCGKKYKFEISLTHHKCAAVFRSPKLSLEGAQQTKVESHKAQTEVDKDNTGSSQCNAETEEMDMQEEKPQTLNTNEEHLNRGTDLRPRGQQQKTNNNSDSSPETEDDSKTCFDSPKKSFCCPACKRCFPQIRGLKMHMRKAHPGEKKLYTAVCNAKPDSLQRSPSEPDVESDTD